MESRSNHALEWDVDEMKEPSAERHKGQAFVNRESKKTSCRTRQFIRPKLLHYSVRFNRVSNEWPLA